MFVFLVLLFILSIILWIVTLGKKIRKEHPISLGKFKLKSLLLGLCTLIIFILLIITAPPDDESNDTKPNSSKSKKVKASPKHTNKEVKNNFKTCDKDYLSSHPKDGQKACNLHKLLAKNNNKHIEDIDIASKDDELEIKNNTILINMLFKDLNEVDGYVRNDKGDELKKTLEQIYQYINHTFGKEDTTLININMMLNLKQTNGLGETKPITPSMLGALYNNHTLDKVNWKTFKESNKTAVNQDIVEKLTPSEEYKEYVNCLDKHKMFSAPCKGTPSIYQ